MELVLALAIGVLTSSGVWLLLRPRTFQIIMGLALLSYAVNLFIFSMGRLGLATGKPPVLQGGVLQDLAHYADPMPQALVLTSLAHQSVRSHRFHARMAEEDNDDNDAAPAGGAR